MKKVWVFTMLSFFMFVLPIHAEEEDFVIHVVNEQQDSLKGIRLEIVNDTTQECKTYESDAKGNISILHMKVGNYSITVEDKGSYGLQSPIDFNITPFNSKNKTKLTIVLKRLFQKETKKDYAIVYVLIAILNMVFYYSILIFQKKTFTQFLDDIVL